jgi:hypothetical protein
MQIWIKFPIRYKTSEAGLLLHSKRKSFYHLKKVVMKKEQSKPAELTTAETQRLESYFWLSDWQFETLIERHCRQIETEIICWTGKKGEREPQYATIFGLDAIFASSKKQCTANFFIRYAQRVYQANRLDNVLKAVELLKREAAIDEYEERTWEQKQKLRKQQKRKRKIRKQAQLKAAQQKQEKSCFFFQTAYHRSLAAYFKITILSSIHHLLQPWKANCPGL